MIVSYLNTKVSEAATLVMDYVLVYGTRGIYLLLSTFTYKSFPMIMHQTVLFLLLKNPYNSQSFRHHGFLKPTNLGGSLNLF
jgi:hypothetical protein